MKISKTILLVILSGLLLLLFTFSCKKEESKIVPSLTTTAVSDITFTSATTGGNITLDGGSPVTARGVCWSTNENPTVVDNKSTDGTGIGSFTSSISDLFPGTTYYTRAYATNSIGTGYGNQIMISTLSKQEEKTVTASIGGTITTKESIKLVIPPNALPSDGVVFIGRTGNEPTSVPNINLEVVGTPITMRLPVDSILIPLQLSFPAHSTKIDTNNYYVFLYNGTTYFPMEYTIKDGIVNIKIDIINWDKSNLETKSLSGEAISAVVIVVLVAKQTPPNSQMGLKNIDLQSGKIKYSAPQVANASSKILLLIHGWTGAPDTWDVFIHKINNEPNHLSYTHYWTFGYNSSKSITTNAEILKSLLKEYSGQATIDIVSHSMGGLVSRYLVEQLDGVQYIQRIVFLGTPHTGAEMAAFRYVIGSFIGSSTLVSEYIYDAYTLGLRDLYTDSKFITTMMASKKAAIPYYQIACTNNFFGICGVSFIIPGDDDGIVSVESAKGVGDAEKAFYNENILVDLAHTRMTSDENIYNQVVEYLKREKPTVITASATEVTTYSAYFGGNITSDGGVTVIDKGIYFWKQTNLEQASTKVSAGAGSGIFSIGIKGLEPNTAYYVKAYAINSQGTAYGEQVKFTTGIDLYLAAVSTDAAKNITTNSATLGGNVTFDGNATVTEKGVVYSKYQNPTTAYPNHKVSASNGGTGAFSSDITGLETNTTYYVRAYAKNSQGTSYGNEVPFNTTKETSNIVNIPDAIFKSYCLQNFDSNGDGEIQKSEAATVTRINTFPLPIESMEGIEYFTALTYLHCPDNHLTSLDISKNKALTQLYCQSNQITTLDVSQNILLTLLQCGSNKLTSLAINNNIALTELSCHSNKLTSLDISKNTSLIILQSDYNGLTSLNVNNNKDLERLQCGNNGIISLNVSENRALTYLDCFGNQITSLNVSNNKALTMLNCGANKLSSLDISENTGLTEFLCPLNEISSLDIGKNTALTKLFCGINKLTSLDVSKNSLLTYLNCLSSPTLTELWMKTGQSITRLEKESYTVIYYKP